jgi:hypothetical protein
MAIATKNATKTRVFISAPTDAFNYGFGLFCMKRSDKTPYIALTRDKQESFATGAAM